MWSRLSKILRAGNLSLGIRQPITCKFTFFVLADCSGTFFDCLKEADVSSNFKKDDPLD